MQLHLEINAFKAQAQDRLEYKVIIREWFNCFKQVFNWLLHIHSICAEDNYNLFRNLKKNKKLRKKNLTLTSKFLVTSNVDKVKQSRTFQIIRQECWTLHLVLRLMCNANKHFCGKGELQMGFSNMYSS